MSDTPTLGQVAENAYNSALNDPKATLESAWQSVADAVLAESRAREAARAEAEETVPMRRLTKTQAARLRELARMGWVGTNQNEMELLGLVVGVLAPEGDK